MTGSDHILSVDASEKAAAAHAAAVERAVGEAMARGAGFVEVIDKVPRSGPLARQLEPAPLPEVNVCETYADRTPPSAFVPGDTVRMIDLRPVSYADLRELHRALRRGDTDRASELAGRFEDAARSMAGGPW